MVLILDKKSNFQLPFITFIKGCYYDPFKWNLIKSIGLTILGIKLARECKGFELMPPVS